MLDHSFTYGNIDMRERFGIVVERFVDVLSPELRTRKISIPFRDGAIDYGAMYYNERILEIHCVTTNMLERADIRALSLVLSKKAQIKRWDEIDKYYVGRIYNPSIIDRLDKEMYRFVLAFSCEPFAYGGQVTEVFQGSAKLTYEGTARTPTRITITNNTGSALNGLTIIMREAVNQ